MLWILLAIAGSSRTAADDQVALERMARGEHDALADLYDRHGRLIYSLALRILRDPGDAEDIVQDVFSQVWRQAARFDVTRGNVVAWLVTMTRTRAIDVLRRRQSRPELVQGAAPLEAVDVSVGQDVRFEWQHRALEIKRAMRTLPPLQRIAIELAYFEGLTQSEIAEHLEIPLGTVKTRVRQGLMKIRDCLAGAGA